MLIKTMHTLALDLGLGAQTCIAAALHSGLHLQHLWIQIWGAREHAEALQLMHSYSTPCAQSRPNKNDINVCEQRG